MAIMHGIDVSKWQSNIAINNLKCDFVIVKATQGTTYVNPYLNQQTNLTVNSGKLLGFYHYASTGGAKNEARHFVNTIKSYIGRALLVLDWEGDGNPNFGNTSYAKEFMDEVYNLTKVKPIIYISKSVCRSHANMNTIASKYELWVAQYANYNRVDGFKNNPWTDNKGYGPWKEPLIYQYTSRGYLPGYAGNLDFDIAYTDRNGWLKRCAVQGEQPNKNTLPRKFTVTLPLNMRKEGDVNSQSVGILSKDSVITGDKKIPNGPRDMVHTEGWVSIKYLERV